MDDSKTSAGKISTDEEEAVGVAKQIDLVNNVQARYASPHRPLALKNSLFTVEESKILSEISLGLRCYSKSRPSLPRRVCKTRQNCSKRVLCLLRIQKILSI
jgi:hypothetical protein